MQPDLTTLQLLYLAFWRVSPVAAKALLDRTISSQFTFYQHEAYHPVEGQVPGQCQMISRLTMYALKKKRTCQGRLFCNSGSFTPCGSGSQMLSVEEGH